MSDSIGPGSLVCLRKKTRQLHKAPAKAVGLVLEGPEPFGFIDRCHVLWSGPGFRVHDWVDLDDLELVPPEKSAEEK
jgi:hypothetical protein